MLDRFQHKAAPTTDASGSLETHVTAGGLTLPYKGGFRVGTGEPRTILLNVPQFAGMTCTVRNVTGPSRPDSSNGESFFQ